MRFCRALCTVWLIGAALMSATAWAADEDRVVFSFAFVGCNRLDKAGVAGTGSASTANEAQLLQTFKDVGSTNPAPNYLILAGDVVKAKKDGTKTLKRQLEAWTQLVQGAPKSTAQLVVFTGNHELLKSASDEDDTEVPNRPAYAYWQAHMKPFILGQDGPRKGGPDRLVNDERGLSYTFRKDGVLFVVLNTDTQIDKATIGDVPLEWVTKKLAEAQSDPTIEHIFVMGHKPVAVPGKTPDSGESNIRQSEGRAFYALLNAPNPAHQTAPTKVRAYLAAHAHEWNYQADLSPVFGTGTVPQIIAGNGGSPPESKWVQAQGYFGYTLISIWRSGKVSAQSFGRAIPATYFAQEPAPLPATPQGAAVTLKP